MGTIDLFPLSNSDASLKYVHGIVRSCLLAGSGLGLSYNGSLDWCERWPQLFGQDVPFLKWRLAVI